MTFGLYLLLNLVLLLFFGWWLRRLVVRRLEPERILADLEEEVRSIILDLNAAGDQNVTLLEDRISGLRTLLQRADTQIDELDYKLRALEEDHYNRSGPHSLPDNETVPEVSDGDLPDESETLVIPFRREQPDGTTEGTAEGMTDKPGDKKVEQSPSDVRRQVLTLHGQGLSSDLIATRTGMAIGEVELIISLGTKRTRQ